MKKLLIGIGVLVVLVIAAAVIVPAVVPLETYKPFIAKAVKDATGRDLSMGEIRLAVLPRLAVEVDNVSFANAPGAASPQMATLKQLAVQVQLLPLLSGNIAVDRFVLVDPVINLEIDQNGKANWVMTPAATPAAPASGGGSSAAGGGISNLQLGDIRLENGTVVYTDRASGRSETLTNIDLAVALPSLDSPLKAEGEAIWKGEAVKIDLTAAKPRALMDGGASAVQASVASAPVNVGFDGTVTNAQPLAVGGTVKLDVPSIRKLAAWAAQPLEMPGTGLGPLSIAGKLDMKGPRIAFTDAQVRIDEIRGTGGVTIDTGGKVPAIGASLNVETLDLNPYLPPEAEKKPSAPGGSGGGGSAGGAPADWSDEPIDMAGLRALNADLSFSAQAIRVREIKIGKSAVKVTLKDGRLVTDLSELNLYEGTGKALLTVDASKDVATIESNLTLAGVQAQPLLTDAADFKRLSGTAEATSTVTTRGKSERELVANANGNGAVTFKDGAVTGFNLAALLRDFNPAALQKGFDEAQKTDFAELAGTYTIKNGLLNNPDLRMLAPLIRVQGAGDVDLPKRTLNYKATPRLVASLEGQTGAADKSGFSVPILITGTWADPNIQPDMAGLVGDALQDPSKIRDQLDKAKDAVGGGAGGIGDALKGLTGGGSSSSPATPAPSSPAPSGGLPDPSKAIKGLFGQ